MLSLSSKQQGEWVEVCFVAAALRRGLQVSKPYGDSCRYDFLVASGSRHQVKISRVQVKSVSVLNGSSFRITLSRGGGRKTGYRHCDLDYIAAYVIPHDVWYIISIAAVAGLKSVRLCPHRPSQCRLELYRNAWHLLDRNFETRVARASRP
jgi:hypothetical protein